MTEQEQTEQSFQEYMNITIGQYYPAKSVLHSLDPRVKFTGTILFLISLFVADSADSVSGSGRLYTFRNAARTFQRS